MTTRKSFLRYFRRLEPPERIETSPDLAPQDAALAIDLRALAQSIQPEREFVARLDGELAQTRLAARPAAQDKPSFSQRLHLAMHTTWAWALPTAGVLVLILIISLLVQMRPRHATPSGPILGTETPTATATVETPTLLPTQAHAVYVVMPGDTLAQIAAYFNVTEDAIMQANHLTSSDEIYMGQSLIIPLPAETATSPTATPSAPPQIVFPKIDRHPRALTVADWASYGYGQPLLQLPTIDPSVPNIWSLDVRGRDLSGLDLRNALNDLLSAGTFDAHTIWPAPDSMPAGFDPQQILELGKNPGLGLRALHEQGITGSGVGVAIIGYDPLLVEHQEYADRLRLYEEINIDPQAATYKDAEAVVSVAVGKTAGVAPGADLYYIAAPIAAESHPSGNTPSELDFTETAQAVRRIVQINQQLPADRKIRVIAMDFGWTQGLTGYDEMVAAVNEANSAGIFVASVNLSTEQTYGFRMLYLGRSPQADPDRFESYTVSYYLSPFFSADPSNAKWAQRLWAPADSRTTAGPMGSDDYAFYRLGGEQNLSVPYMAGVYALAAQVDPAITPEQFGQLAMQTGRTIQVNVAGQSYPLGPVIDPAALIARLQAASQAPTAGPTPVPAGVFPLLFYPPAMLTYDTSVWVDRSEYTNTAEMINYLQARGLASCQLDSARIFGFLPTSALTVTLGSIQYSVEYQVTTLAGTPAESTTAYYIDSGSLAGYPYAEKEAALLQGVIILTVTANSDQWEACKTLAETTLSTLQLANPATTPVDYTEQALLAELQGLAAKRAHELLSTPGWLYVHIKRTSSSNCGGQLPNGAINPCEIEEHDWYQLNARGEVMTSISRQYDPSGNLFQESVTRGGVSRNLTFGFEITAPLTTTYATDWGFVAHAAAALAQSGSASLLPDSSNGASTAHSIYHLLAAGGEKQDAMFDPQTGALQTLMTWIPDPGGFGDGFTLSEGVEILEEARLAQPPDDFLALLDQPLTPYQPLPPQGDPVPAGYDLAYSTLGMRNIAGDSFNAPTFWYGDIYVDGPYLVGRVDFGSTPGGYCQRSPDGLKLAFDHVTLTNQAPAVQQLRWLELSNPAEVHNGPSDLQLVSLPAWAPDSSRLAFTACDANQSCGLYTYNTPSGAVQRLAEGGNALPPVWSPDGTEIAFQTGPGEAPQSVVVNATSGTVNAAPAWQPQFVNLKDAGVLNQCTQPPSSAPTRPAPPADWKTYANTQYGFSFRYPADWTLAESSNSVLLTKGTLQISIGFRNIKEQVSITRTGVGSGDISPDGHVSFFGLALRRDLLAYGGKLKAVLYDSAAETTRGDLVFTLSLDDFNLDYEAVDLSAEVQQMADQVVESFTWIPTPP